MNKDNFDKLLESVKEVGLIENGELSSSREFVVEKRFTVDSPNVNTFAICLSSQDEDLIPLKIYHVVLQPRHKTCTVKDENNETTVYPIDWFLPVEFSSNIERLIKEAELALA